MSFELERGACRLLRVARPEDKAAVIDVAVGERAPEAGRVAFEGAGFDTAPPGSIGWVPEDGGLIGNLKTWENVTLPLWYHRERRVAETEAVIFRWLTALGVPDTAMAGFMASPAARLSLIEHKRAGLLRGLLLAPRVLVVDAALFSRVPQEEGAVWTAALEALADGEAGSGVLAVAAPGDPGPAWQTIMTE